MTKKQIWHYRWLEGECRKAMRRFGRGMTKVDWERERMAIHAEAKAIYTGDDVLCDAIVKGRKKIGDPKSSLDLSRDEFTTIKGKFLAWFKPSDMDAQREIELQPYIRWRFLVDDLLDRISAILEVNGRGHQAVNRGPGREGYLLNMARRMGGRREELIDLENVNACEKSNVMTALMVRYDQVTAPEKQPGFGEHSPTRTGKAPRRRPFDAPTATQRDPEPPKKLAPCLKPVRFEEDDIDAGDTPSDDSGLKYAAPNDDDRPF